MMSSHFARGAALPSGWTRYVRHCTAIERLRILEVKAARGWSREQVARVFLLDGQTVWSWQGGVRKRVWVRWYGWPSR